ncbi:MAG: cytidylate kinase-like family protein [Clostridia bacterium]|nr:cytidylate kinase-like family protein [Clostridia bacterium]
MNKIITIGREFGSGGREIGKRLAEKLGIAYYDKEIMSEIANRTQLAEQYVHQIIEQGPQVFFPITTGRTLHHQYNAPDYLFKQYNAVYTAQATVLRELAEKSSCVIVGRCADYILRDMNPLRLFIYAEMPAKVKRCRLKAELHENLSDKELMKKIRRIDKSRAKYYQYYTGHKWGKHENYDLCINTTSLDVKHVAELLENLIRADMETE